MASSAVAQTLALIGPSDKQTDKITVNAHQAALTCWATKHVRITADFHELGVRVGLAL